DGGQLQISNNPSLAVVVGLRDLSPGTHVFEVFAVDELGNSGEASFTWTVDTAGPVVMIPLSPDPIATSSSALIVVDAFDFEGPAFTEYSLDAGAWTPLPPDGVLDFTGLADGQHRFDVRSTDRAGNTSSAKAIWVVDTMPPDTEIVSGPPAL